MLSVLTTRQKSKTKKVAYFLVQMTKLLDLSNISTTRLLGNLVDKCPISRPGLAIGSTWAEVGFLA